MSSKIIAIEILYYDKHEYYDGDGFYPNIKNTEPYTEKTYVSFLYDSVFNYWVQIDGICISGLDGDIGEKLLNIMNKKYYVNCIEIVNSFGVRIYPKITYLSE